MNSLDLAVRFRMFVLTRTQFRVSTSTISAVPLKVEQIQLHTGLVVRELVAEVGKPF